MMPKGVSTEVFATYLGRTQNANSSAEIWFTPATSLTSTAWAQVALRTPRAGLIRSFKVKPRGLPTTGQTVFVQAAKGTSSPTLFGNELTWTIATSVSAYQDLISSPVYFDAGERIGIRVIFQTPPTVSRWIGGMFIMEVEYL